jgi:hypothetical protein
MNSSAKEKVALVPLETELRQAHRRREVLDQLSESLGRVGQILRGGLSPEQFSAYEALQKGLKAAVGIVKNFRC